MAKITPRSDAPRPAPRPGTGSLYQGPSQQPSGDYAGPGNRPNGAAQNQTQIMQAQGTANVNQTLGNTANNTAQSQYGNNANINGEYGNQEPVTQNTYEQQALMALQQQGNMSLAAQQQAAEAAMQQSAFTQQTAMQTAAQKPLAQQGRDDMALLRARLAHETSMQGSQFGQDNSMFQQRVGANNAQQAAMWARIESMGGTGSFNRAGISDPPTPGPDPNEQAARDATFAREKDRIGAMGRGAVNSLAGLMSERGTVGGGYEQQGMADVVGGTRGQLGDVAREQTIQDLNRGSQVSDRNYAGDIAKRGQDIQYRQALLQLMNQQGAY